LLDDGNGGHHCGPDAITTFISSLTANAVVHEAAAVANGERVMGYGTVGSDTLEPRMFRWAFHLSDGLIAHLSNSYLRAFPDIARPDIASPALTGSLTRRVEPWPRPGHWSPSSAAPTWVHPPGPWAPLPRGSPETLRCGG
jgi:hypothetical protein